MFLTLFLIFSFSAQVPFKGRARGRGSETEGATDGGQEEDVGRGEKEKKDVPGYGQKNDGCVSASGSVKQSACCYRTVMILTEGVCHRGPPGEGETRAKRANGTREQRE